MCNIQTSEYGFPQFRWSAADRHHLIQRVMQSKTNPPNGDGICVYLGLSSYFIIWCMQAGTEETAFPNTLPDVLSCQTPLKSGHIHVRASECACSVFHNSSTELRKTALFNSRLTVLVLCRQEPGNQKWMSLNEWVWMSLLLISYSTVWWCIGNMSDYMLLHLQDTAVPSFSARTM